MTSHWPTFADGLFWCACDNRTFATQDEWQAHVVESVWRESLPKHSLVYISPNTGDVECRCGFICHRSDIIFAVDDYAQHRVDSVQPVDVAVEQPHRGS